MTGICVTLIEPKTVDVIDRMADLAGVADLFEIRGDHILDADLLTILRTKTKPLVFTCRSESEGGRAPDADPRRRLQLLEAVRRGYDYVDVEHRSGLLDVMLEKAGHGLIVSYHDLQGTPEDLAGLYRAMCAQGADVVKIAVTPHSIRDVGRLLAFATQVAREGDRPLIPIALGPMGILTRILAGRYGAPFTYACAAHGSEAASGQIPASRMAGLYRARDVSPATEVYGILGADVTWSLSPALHNPAFQERGIDAVYVPLQAEAVDPFVQALPSLGLSGFGVTRPYKVDILKHLQQMDDTAALCGSVNTVSVRDGALYGATTDGIGVTAPLKKRLPLKDQRVVIVGAGGAARAAALALVQKGAKVTVLARDPLRAQTVAGAVDCRSGALSDLERLEWDVLINATPVGSMSLPDETPVPASLHRPGRVVFDMVYQPLATRLLREAQAAGSTTINGLEMLVGQAAAQFETWTGKEAPIEVMKQAAVAFLEEQRS